MTTVSLVSALAVRENVVRVAFDSAPYYSAVLDPGDASDLARWAVSTVADSIGGDGEPPRLVSPARVVAVDGDLLRLDVWLDRRLSPFPSRYVVRANGLRTADLTGGLGNDRVEFLAVRAGAPAPLADAGISNADIANPQTVSGLLGLPNPDASQLGTWPVDDTGDLAREQGVASYKKRVLRRLTTPKGKYPHLPGYGVGFLSSVKALARAGAVAALAADAEDQVRQEPETLACRVTVEQVGAVAYFRVRARCAFGTVDVLSPVVFN